MITFSVNGQARSVDVDPDTPLLWVLRDTLGLTGTKYGCGMALCGACTVHVDGQATRICVMPVSAAQGKQITTIEGFFDVCRAKGPERRSPRTAAQAARRQWIVRTFFFI